MSCEIVVSRQLPVSSSHKTLPGVRLNGTLAIMSLAAGLIFAVLMGARLSGAGAVIRFGQFDPGGDSIGFVYVDITRGLDSQQAFPLDTRSLPNRDTAADGRRVVSRRNSGNIDLYQITPDGARTRLTHFTDFPSAQSERGARRANQIPIWSPDDRWIAFISADVSGRLSLWALPENGGGLRHLGDHIRMSAALQPRWVTFGTGFPAEMVIGLAGVLLLWRLLIRSRA